MANDARVCIECGAELTTDSPQGLCPRCLLKRARGSSESDVRDQLSEEETLRETEPRPASSPGRPREGQRFGDYQLVRLLGEGGMGAVYEAEHLPSERRVALKVLTHRLDSPEARRRFLREGQLAASINHPNSVYIFGTEEIDGIPVISMELVPGGTLKDRVKEKGPMPVTEAVDVILQVIAGLEAAHAKGVLHRDIKPSNCFVDADGTVKIGDFGLSLSLASRGETQLTVTGAFLGTPAFSSPEQLRGEEVDLRADIYSVGVTLYYLLTGRPPFEGDNVVNLLATVLEKPPLSPASLRREIPRELAKVVLRCLEKARERRFGSYDEMRQALLPFSSAAPTPAPLVQRASANVVDGVLLTWLEIGATGLLALGAHAGDVPGAMASIQSGHRFQLAVSLTHVLYYGVTEGIWGASPGKMQFRLCVVGPSRNAPGIFKGVLRAVLFNLLPSSPVWLALALEPAVGASGQPSGLMGGAALISVALRGLLFCTMRRANGFAAVHDLLTNTRVIRKPSYRARSLIRLVEEPPPSLEGSQSLGPFKVLETLWKKAADELRLAWDPVLNRRVWIRLLPPGTPALSPHRRTVSRAGRLRLLNGKRTPDECWDAYEAVRGEALLRQAREGQTWKAVRVWLLDLAEELNAAAKDQTLPDVLALDRVWITAEGRAKLLEFSGPGLPIAEQRGEPTNGMGSASVSGGPLGVPPSGMTHGAPGRVFGETPNTAGQRPALPSPAETEQKTPGCAEFLMQVAVAALTGVRADSPGRSSPTPAIPLALHARTFLARLKDAAALEGVITELKSIQDRETEVTRATRFKLWFACGLAQLVCALSLVGVALWKVAFGTPSLDGLKDWLFATITIGTAYWVFCVVLPGLVGALLFRGGYLIHRLGLTFVTADGAPASRLRIFGRGVATWFPVVAGVLAALINVKTAGYVMGAVYLFYGAAGMWAVLTPSRSLQDRIAGTWMVPK